MARILVLGASGMLGHKMYQVMRESFDTYAAFRHFDGGTLRLGIFDTTRTIDGIDAFNFETIGRAIDQTQPNFVINCIGIIKQKSESKSYPISIYVNALLPHLVAEYCAKVNCKFIHISTDCVFSGKKGNYTEEDSSDAKDLYGKSKYLGEVAYGDALTLRTSIVGHGLSGNSSLVDWFLAQNDSVVNGYKNAVYTGFPTVVLSREVVRIITEHPDLKGLYNLSSEKISKFDLLSLIKEIYDLKTPIVPDEDFVCDRSLNSLRYRTEVDFTPQSWEQMVEQMHTDYLKFHN